MSLLMSIFTEFIENTWKATLIQMTDLFSIFIYISNYGNENPCNDNLKNAAFFYEFNIF
jgi:hypothetical protein